ncbi:DUF63 family protein [Haloferax sp. ATB1]|uniref:DUF63 family protein n=1 Tax=Haloferax sp. ATB1 TaxID=1508454 RepID=UPI0018E3B2C3|nr:DUF63 family protein [Haloferax sp. ATB1]
MLNETSIAFAATGVLVAGVTWVLYHRRVAVTAAEIGATLPWFAVIGIAVAVGRSTSVSGFPAGFLQSPTVYLVVGALVAGLWVIFDFAGIQQRSRWMAASGVLMTLIVGGGTVITIGAPQPRVLVWNGVAVVLAVGVTVLVLWTVPSGYRSTPGWLGAGVLFAHALDATTTGVGLEKLGTTERNPISAALIQMGEGAGVSGVLLFLVVKVAVALLILRALDSDVDPAGRETISLLVVAAGAGLVPAVHNLTLFALTVS